MVLIWMPVSDAGLRARSHVNCFRSSWRLGGCTQLQYLYSLRGCGEVFCEKLRGRGTFYFKYQMENVKSIFNNVAYFDERFRGIFRQREVRYEIISFKQSGRASRVIYSVSMFVYNCQENIVY